MYTVHVIPILKVKVSRLDKYFCFFMNEIHVFNRTNFLRWDPAFVEHVTSLLDFYAFCTILSS